MPKMPQLRFEFITVVVFIVINVILLFYSIITIITGPTSGPGVIAYEINIIILVVVQLAMMLFFLLYGVYLSFLIKRAGKVGTTKHATPAKTLLKVAALYSFCYFLRAFAFLYRPISRCLLPYWVFWLLAYYLPEFISTFHVVWTYWKVEIRAEREREEYRKRWANGVFNASSSNSSRSRPVVAGNSRGAQQPAAEPQLDQQDLPVRPISPDPLSPTLWISGNIWVAAAIPHRPSLLPGGSQRTTQADLNAPLLADEVSEGPAGGFASSVSSSLLESQLAGTAAQLGSINTPYTPPTLSPKPLYSEGDTEIDLDLSRG